MRAEDVCARRADAALACAAALPTRDAARLAHALYTFGRLPLTDRWVSALAAHGGVVGLLDLDRLQHADAVLARRWTARGRGRTAATWLLWDRAPRPAARSTPPRRARATYKLYLAPTPSAMPDAVAPALATLARSGAFAFKVAATAAALLRPDKLVAHFHTRAALDAAAAMLRPALDGVPAHPVPFTAAITPDGLLSWGMDPPRRTPDAADAGAAWPSSWRGWVTARLGAYLADAPDDAEDGAAARRAAYARRRLADDGVDVAAWTPRAPRWGAP